MGNGRRPSGAMRRRAIWTGAVPAFTVAVALVAGGCGGSSATTQASTAGGSGGDACAGQEHTIYYATHAFPHPFFTPLMNGAKDGAKDNCLKETWTQSPKNYDITDTIQRIQAGIAQKPDVLVVSVPDAKAQDATIRKAIDAGIKVIAVNARDTRPALEQPAYLSYVGISDETQTGIAAAKALLEVNPHPTLAAIGNNQPGDPALTKRVNGFKDTMKAAGVSVDEINTQNNAAEAIQSYLAAHPQLDALYTLGSGPSGSSAARQVIKNLGRTDKVKLVATDYDETDLQAIKDGTQVAAIDQQQYLQGYLPAVISRLYFDTGQAPPLVNTGPDVIDKNNVDQAIADLKKGNR